MAYFTLEEARELLPEVKEITAHYFQQAQTIQQKLHDNPTSSSRQDLLQRLHFVVSQWMREINSLGAEVKGPWLVDFDSGDGIYFCWRYGEDQLDYFHRYETGFRDRRPLSKLKSSES